MSKFFLCSYSRKHWKFRYCRLHDPQDSTHCTRSLMLELIHVIPNLIFSENTMDILEQRQAMEQARLLQRFKELRQWQMHQQEILMKQQQMQLEVLRKEQMSAQGMIVKQRESHWGRKALKPSLLLTLLVKISQAYVIHERYLSWISSLSTHGTNPKYLQNKLIFLNLLTLSLQVWQLYLSGISLTRLDASG